MSKNPQLWSRQGLRKALGTIRPRPIDRINNSDVPSDLRLLVPVAEWWGIDGDEEMLYGFVDRAPIDAVTNLCIIVDTYDRTISEWLAGPEAESGRPTQAYLTFTALVMASDYGKVRLKRNTKGNMPS